jgi:hypothetical protein
MWSSGTGYNIYGLTLAAATMVPLQVRHCTMKTVDLTLMDGLSSSHYITSQHAFTGILELLGVRPS